MKTISWACFECGSAPVSTRVEEGRGTGPILVISFACGAVLRTSKDTSVSTGSMVFAGCNHEE